MKLSEKVLVVTFVLAVFVPELVLSSKKANKANHVYNPQRSNNSVSKAFTRIMGGNNAPHGHYPWHAQLLFNGCLPFCGGVLIQEQWVLTAAHCIQENGVVDTSFLVRLGAYKIDDSDFSSYGQEFNVSKIILHDQFNATDLSHDAALLKLDKSVAESLYVKKVHLPMEEDANKVEKCRVTGFGAVNDKGDLAQHMQKLEVKIYPLEHCKYFPDTTFDKSMLCAGTNSSGYQTGEGDSGGPLVCFHNVPGDPYFYLYGILSWSEGPHTKDIYTDVIYMLPWIKSQTKVV